MNRKERREMKKSMKKGLSGKLSPLGLVWFIHFGSISPDEATCNDCRDFKEGSCKGGQDPVECMLEKEQNTIVF